MYANRKSVLKTILSSHLITVAKSTHCLTRSCFLPDVVLPPHFTQCLNSTTWTPLGLPPFTKAPGMFSDSTSCYLAVRLRRNSSSFTSRKFGHGDISLTWTPGEFSNWRTQQMFCTFYSHNSMLICNILHIVLMNVGTGLHL